MPTTTLHRQITLLMYADIAAAHDWLARVFDLTPGELVRNGEGDAVHAELRAGDGTIWLHAEQEPLKLASPQSLGSSTANLAVIVDDVDAHYRKAVDLGAVIEHEPVDQPYGYREYSVRDLEGHLWSFMRPLG